MDLSGVSDWFFRGFHEITAPLQDSFHAHGTPLGDKEVTATWLTKY